MIRRGILGLSRELVSLGHQVTILTPFQFGYSSFKIDGIKIELMPACFIPKIRYTIPSLPHYLTHLLKKSEIDVLHVWSYFYLTSLFSVYINKFEKIPTVVTVDAFPGVSWSYGGLRMIDFLGEAYTRTLGKKTLMLCDKVILLFNGLKNSALQLGIPLKKVSVIPNGVDFKCFNPKIDGTAIRKEMKIEKFKMILFVGRLVPVKGLPVLIDAMKNLLEMGLDVKLVVVGDGPYKNEYKMCAKEIRENVLFLGYRQDVPSLIAACDVVVLPSISEGQPSILLEAGACAKPVVSSNVGAASEIVIHGKTGYLFEPCDIKSLSDYLIKILSSKTLREKMGICAFHHIRNNYDQRKTAKKYLEVYKKIIASTVY